MRLAELKETVLRSAPHHWERVVNDGPTYRNQWQVSKSADSDHIDLDVDAHTSVFVYAEDIDITIGYGMALHFEGSFTPSRSLSFPWSESFPDSDVFAQLADVFYRGSLVWREYVLVVDGGRGLVPFGRTRLREGVTAIMSRNPDDYEQVCTKQELEMTRLLSGLQGFTAGDLEHHMELVGYRVIA